MSKKRNKVDEGVFDFMKSNSIFKSSHEAGKVGYTLGRRFGFGGKLPKNQIPRKDDDFFPDFVDGLADGCKEYTLKNGTVN